MVIGLALICLIPGGHGEVSESIYLLVQMKTENAVGKDSTGNSQKAKRKKGSFDPCKACMKYIFHGNLGKGFCPEDRSWFKFHSWKEGLVKGIWPPSQGTNIPFAAPFFYFF